LDEDLEPSQFFHYAELEHLIWKKGHTTYVVVKD